MDKFINFTLNEVDEHFEHLLGHIKKEKANLFFIDLFSSELALEKYTRCNLLELDEYFDKPHAEELKKVLFDKFFPNDTTKITHFNSYFEHILDCFDLVDFYPYIPTMLSYIKEKSANKKIYSDYIEKFIDQLSWQETSFDYNWFNDIEYTNLSDAIILKIIECASQSEEFYDYIMSKKPQANLISQGNFVKYLFIDGYKNKDIYDFFVKHNALNALAEKENKQYAIQHCPQLLKLAKTQLDSQDCIDVLMNLKEKISLKKITKNFHSLFGEDLFNQALEERLNSIEKVHSFLKTFYYKLDMFNFTLELIDKYYPYFVQYTNTCPFQVLKEIFEIDNSSYWTTGAKDAFNQLKPYLLESDKRLLEFKLQASVSATTKKIKI